MDITFSCTNCGQSIEIDESGAGQEVQCPQCGSPLLVPTAMGQAAGEPVKAPVATEVPPTPFLTAEARSATTWKCPTCAEEIQKDAKKCRFCGMILTKAAKMGYPAFYENVAKNGLSFTSLLFDYADFLYPDEGWIDCCLSASNILGNFFDNPNDDHKTKLLERAGGIVKAMRERLSDIPAESQEALTIKAGCKFLWMVRDFARLGDPINDPHTLQFAISHFTELKQTLSHIEPENRRDLEQHIDYAIRACQDQLGRIGKTCSEPSSTVPPLLDEQDTTSGADRDLSHLPKTLTLDLGRGSGLSGLFGSRLELELVLIPAGSFVMENVLEEELRTELGIPNRLHVTISNPYYMGKYPVSGCAAGTVSRRPLQSPAS